MENINLETIINSKAFVSGGLAYKSPSEYINPYLDMLDRHNYSDLIIKTSSPIENRNEDGSANTSYGRVMVQARINFNSEFTKTIGFVYALDTQKPIIKAYSGISVNACTNLCIFNPEHVESVSILDSKFSKIYETVNKFCQNIDSIADSYMDTVNTLKGKTLNHNDLHIFLGKFLEHGIKYREALGTNIVMATAKSLYEPSSRYFVKPGEETTAWNVYNSATQFITNKADIVEAPTKTLLLKDIL